MSNGLRTVVGDHKAVSYLLLATTAWQTAFAAFAIFSEPLFSLVIGVVSFRIFKKKAWDETISYLKTPLLLISLSCLIVFIVYIPTFHLNTGNALTSPDNGRFTDYQTDTSATARMISSKEIA